MGKGYKIDVNSLIGQKFHQLTITQYLGSFNGINKVVAICDCGVEKEFRLGNIIGNGKTKSCGCFNKKVTAERNTKLLTKHGLTGHPLMSVYNSMKSRCYDITDVQYKNWGAKGVRMCKEWLDNPKVFYDWAMENGWKKGLQIDKDKLATTKPGLLYSPEFCCFLTAKENACYKSNSIMLEYNGQTKSISEWADVLNIPYKLLESRYNYGWDAKKMFETPLKKAKLIEFNNDKKTLQEWALIYNLEYKTVHSRINKLGWNYEQAFTTPLIPPSQSGVHKKHIA